MQVKVLWIGCVALCLAATVAWGAEGPVKTKHALDLELQGSLDLGFIYRNNTFSDAFWGPAIPSATQSVDRAFSGSSSTNQMIADGRRISPTIFDRGGSMFVADPQLSVGLKATLPKNVHAFIELATPFYVIGEEGGSTAFRRRGSVFYRDLDYDRVLVVEQAFVELRDFIVEDSGLDLRVGITDYALDFRGNGNPFLLDIQNAENPFLSATGAQQYVIVDSNGNYTWDMDDATDTRIDPGPFGRNSQEAVGAIARYSTDTGILQWDNYFFNIFESYERNRDDFVAGSTLTVYFDQERQYGKIAPTFLAMANDSTAAVYTIGTGVQFFPLSERILELYGEGYWQAGTYAKNVDVSASSTYGARHYSSIDMRDAYAFYAGVRLGWPGTERDDFAGDSLEDASLDLFAGMQPYVDLSYWEVSGDDEADSDKNESFVTLENNNLSLIVESSYWGLDIDTNYRAIRLEAGFYPYRGLHVKGCYGYFEYQDNNGTVDNRTGSRRNKIGDEVDLIMTYEYSTHVKLQLGTGFLFDPRALGTTHTLNLSMCRMIVDF